MIKTYQLINDINLTTPILYDEKPRMISFSGGMKNSGEEVRHGSFTTADEKMQKALEADGGFGRVFGCIAAASAQARANDKNNCNPSGLTQIPGITNKQNALEWLNDNKVIEIKATESADTVKATALKNGIEFPDWK